MKRNGENPNGEDPNSGKTYSKGIPFNELQVGQLTVQLELHPNKIISSRTISLIGGGFNDIHYIKITKNVQQLLQLA
jgi:hypothetical protein